MSYTLTAAPDDLRDRFLKLKQPENIATILDVKYRDFIYWIYRTPARQRYTTFAIKKKSGAPRKIDAPNQNIKILQQKLNQVLQSVYKPKYCVQGFVSGRSVRKNALRHTSRKHVFNIDLKDFFPSINFGRVRGMFMGKPFNLPPKVATVLAHLCCSDGRLPQGAPTSPVVSNMICAKMDSQLQRLAAINHCTYTRYADDITFSTSHRVFPSAIATINSLNQVEPGDELRATIQENGFSIHPEKIWLRQQNRRQEVTGVTVNDFPNLPRKFINQIRAMLHAWEKHDLAGAQAHFETKYDHKHRYKSKPKFQHVVKGKIEYLGMIKGQESSTYLRFLDRLGRLDPKLAGNRGTPLELLSRRYNSLVDSQDPHGRGYLLQDLLRDTFKYFNIPVAKSFTRNNGGEQIDGAFELAGSYYIVECRWREKVADIRQVDGLYAQVDRSGPHTMGIYFSVNGWSDNVPKLLKQNSRKVIILMDGQDFCRVLAGDITMEDMLRKKVNVLSIKAEPFISVKNIIENN